jgi:glycosyltransferase involved in cell wall biosynthesis
MTRLSVILITYNEEDNIQNCLDSVKWADEIVIVDSKSTDNTVKIAKKYTKNVFIKDWIGYSENKNLALEKCTGDWVLWIDADERVMPDLAKEIKSIIDSNPPEHGFEMARRAYFLGKWIKRCGWYPGYVLRLFKKEHARFSDSKVHEGIELNGDKGRLNYDLLHFTDKDLDHYLWKFNRYTSYAAQELAENGRSGGIAAILFRPFFAFIKMYFFKQGFLDGVEGLMLCLLSSGYVAMKYAKLWETQKYNSV